jgi:hypothetical protein
MESPHHMAHWRHGWPARFYRVPSVPLSRGQALFLESEIFDAHDPSLGHGASLGVRLCARTRLRSVHLGLGRGPFLCVGKLPCSRSVLSLFRRCFEAKCSVSGGELLEQARGDVERAAPVLDELDPELLQEGPAPAKRRLTDIEVAEDFSRVGGATLADEAAIARA